MNDEILYRIRDFVGKQYIDDAENITRETRVEEDLGVTGDDVFDFFIAFGKSFNVDVSNFLAADYFDGEGDAMLPAMMGFLTGKKPKSKKALTIGHLEKAILAGRLDEEVINFNK